MGAYVGECSLSWFRSDVTVVIAQPGLSKAAMTYPSLYLLACTEPYLNETYSEPVARSLQRLGTRMCRRASGMSSSGLRREQRRGCRGGAPALDCLPMATPSLKNERVKVGKLVADYSGGTYRDPGVPAGLPGVRIRLRGCSILSIEASRSRRCCSGRARNTRRRAAQLRARGPDWLMSW